MSTTTLSAGGALLSAGQLLGVSDSYPALATLRYAQDFIAAAGITDATQREAARTFERRLLAAGVLDAYSRAACLDVAIWPLIGGSSSSHHVNFIDPSRDALTFYGSPQHSSTGIAWNGQQYADTGVIPSQRLIASDLRISVYTRQARGNGDTMELGSQQGANGLFLSSYSSFQNLPYSRTPGGDLPATDPAPAGYFATSTNQMAAGDVDIDTKLFFNGGVIGNAGSANDKPLGLSPLPVWLACLNLDGSFYGGTNRAASYYSIGRRYTLPQETAVFQAVQELQTTLNRAV